MYQNTDKLTLLKRGASLTALAAGFALLAAGCGGTKTFNNTLRATLPSTPTAYGLEATAFANGVDTIEVSGLSSAAGSPYLTAATASTAVPISTQAGAEGTIPLGFAPGGKYLNSVFPAAVAPGASVQFRASISNGVDTKTNLSVPINPNGVVLTSSEVAGFSQALSFAPDTSNQAFANATYSTGTFTLPFTTTGLHSLTVSVTDQENTTTTTTYDVAVVGPSDAAVVAELVDSKGNAVTGATATITNPVTGARAQTTSDDNGVVVLFAAPGAETISATKGALTGTDTQTLVAGQALTSTGSGATQAAYTIKLQ